MSVEWTCPVCHASWRCTIWDNPGYESGPAKKRTYSCWCGYEYDPEKPRTEYGMPWFIAGGKIPAVAQGWNAGEKWTFSADNDKTRLSWTVDSVMFWPRELNITEVHHVYTENIDGKRCDCPLCTEGRRK